MALTPQYADVPLLGSAQISTANTSRDGTGTVATVVSPGDNGSRIEEILVQATGTTTAGMVRLYLTDGVTTRLFAEIPVTAITPSATVAAFTASRKFTNLVLPFDMSILASTEKAETFNVFAFGGSF